MSPSPRGRLGDHAAVRALAPFLLLAASTSSCSGFSIGVRQDSDDKASFTRVLDAQAPGSRFPAGRLLDKGWSRLFVFRGGISTQAIEDRIGIPFPQSGEAIPAATSYLVFADDEAVVSAFSYAGPRDVDATCFLAERVPLDPRTELVLGDGEGGRASLSTSPAADRCR